MLLGMQNFILLLPVLQKNFIGVNFGFSIIAVGRFYDIVSVTLVGVFKNCNAIYGKYSHEFIEL